MTSSLLSHWTHSRSLLFVPATDLSRVQKAARSEAHAVILDLEDAVAKEDKPNARRGLPLAVAAVHTAQKAALVRINHDVLCLADDLRACVAAKVDAIVLPKAHEVETLRLIDAALTDLGDHRMECLAMVETPAAIADMCALQALARAPRVRGLALGPEDFSRSVGVAPSQTLLLPAVNTLVMAARSVGLNREIKVWAMPDSIALIDADEKWQSALEVARKLGVDGVLCIHPRQLASVHRVFSASAEEISWAKGVLATAQDNGEAVFCYQGEMIDKPVLERALQILQGG